MSPWHIAVTAKAIAAAQFSAFYAEAGIQDLAHAGPGAMAALVET